ncbi:hypothetical protein XELAEV_18003634mg [Xenopus laevis]|uniref:Uncharacterized protein n=1 Tax=Xenopus laevis TaxID=8355 RepID=A0A974BNE2_XENLA|nr:hypothetical protein XELAEV_18003634mg [Xenopus laevis]
MIFMRPNHEKPGLSQEARSSCVRLISGSILSRTPSSTLAVILTPKYVMDFSSTEKSKECRKRSKCEADREMLSRLDF